MRATSPLEAHNGSGWRQGINPWLNAIAALLSFSVTLNALLKDHAVAVFAVCKTRGHQLSCTTPVDSNGVGKDEALARETRHDASPSVVWTPSISRKADFRVALHLIRKGRL